MVGWHIASPKITALRAAHMAALAAPTRYNPGQYDAYHSISLTSCVELRQLRLFLFSFVML